MTSHVKERLLSGTSRINSYGHLEIGGCDSLDLVREHGTPLMVYDEALIRDNCRRYMRAFAVGDNRVAYAGKAFLSVGLCQLIEEEGLYLDVVSGGELHTALCAGFPPERIYFHGNNKTPSELTQALEAGVGCIVVDNNYEYQLLRDLLPAAKKPPAILLRVALGVDAATHKYIQTGQHDSKFGFTINSVELESVVNDLIHSQLRFLGFHSHIGSQITTLNGFKQAVGFMFSVVEKYKNDFNWCPVELSFGGGLGIPYLGQDEVGTIEELTSLILATASEEMKRLGVSPRLVIEPGRSIVGSAGTTFYTIGSSKRIPGVRNYIAIDGGMTDNPRPALYQAKYECMLAGRAQESAAETYSIAGRCCESGDMLIWDYKLPNIEHGDVLAVFATGAYNYSMASNYNRIPRPLVLLVAEGCARVLIARESYADLVRLDCRLR